MTLTTDFGFGIPTQPIDASALTNIGAQTQQLQSSITNHLQAHLDSVGQTLDGTANTITGHLQQPLFKVQDKIGKLSDKIENHLIGQFSNLATMGIQTGIQPVHPDDLPPVQPQIQPASHYPTPSRFPGTPNLPPPTPPTPSPIPPTPTPQPPRPAPPGCIWVNDNGNWFLQCEPLPFPEPNPPPGVIPPLPNPSLLPPPTPTPSPVPPSPAPPRPTPTPSPNPTPQVEPYLVFLNCGMYQAAAVPNPDATTEAEIESEGWAFMPEFSPIYAISPEDAQNQLLAIVPELRVTCPSI